ncbi:DinB family protein [Bacillus gaemokensis]|uniref:Damage-inducible protein DinB n=1 Tax=Bacillus gaemokensis TaxID=574375 RepID=A0A073K8M5_9BACI|nr:DinB family protein [Bacillus gaemokensis]KEK22881.1 damage-inducible protein DinB [Bacillus gaemokensis]KYG34682.1 damage-inducible protein DinB [Bacillus gaemokensis]
MDNMATQMYHYNVWGNEQIFKHLHTLPRETYHQEIQSVFSSISKVLAHVYLSDLGWLEILSGKSMNYALSLAKELKEKTEANGIKEMEIKFKELSDKLQIFIKQQENLEKDILIKNPSGDQMKMSISEILLHISNHGTYHRGNITAMLRQMGHTSVMTDYGFYLYVKSK